MNDAPAVCVEVSVVYFGELIKINYIKLEMKIYQLHCFSSAFTYNLQRIQNVDVASSYKHFYLL